MADSDTWERIGQLIDRLDNVIGALELPMPAPFHVQQVKSILPEISKELKAVVIAESGDNPWE